MNIKVWAKLVNETGLIGRKFNMTSADIIFAKVAEGNKLLQYRDFLWMLALCAEERGESFHAVAERVASHAPASSGTQAEFVLWHDDKSTFTGAHAGLSAATVTDRKGWARAPAPVSVDGVERLRVLRRARRRGRKQARCHGATAWEHLCRDAGLFGLRGYGGDARGVRGRANRAPPSSGTWTGGRWTRAEKVSVTYGDSASRCSSSAWGRGRTRQRGDDDVAAAGPVARG